MRCLPPLRGVAAPLPPARVATLLVALTACGGDHGGTTEAPPPIARLTIDQAALDTLSELGTRQLRVSAVDTKGQPRTGAPIAWQSSDTAVASVSGEGLVTARQPGSATITAATGGVSTALALRVLAVPVQGIGIRLVGAVSADTLLVGTTVALAAQPLDAVGRPLLGRRATFSVAPGAAGAVDADGRLTGRAVGPLEVIARVDTVERRQTVIVRPPFAAALALRLADPKKLRDTLWVGLRDSAVVAFADSAGAPLAGTPYRPVSFAIDDPKVALVDFEGRVTPLAPGTVTLRAAGDRLTTTKVLRVVAAPITTLAAAPDTMRVFPGETAQLRPAILDGAGLRVTALGARVLRYESLDPAVATVDAQGVVRAVAPGAARIRLSAERGAAEALVRVLPPVGAPPFAIEVRFVGAQPAAEVVEAFALAARRWQGVIRETTGAAAVSIPRGCSSQTTRTETITDVVIYAEIDSIDGPGNVLGAAGPCVIKRTATRRSLPVVGSMIFDSADVRGMITSGRIQHVIAHEMGHVLGIGTLWSSFYTGGTALATQSGSDPRYSGPAGMLAAVGMGFTALSVVEPGATALERVPLENTGGSGTAGSHWRRSVFGNELMNGYSGTGNAPLSLLTVQAMADLGYAVGSSAAEPWGQFFIQAAGTSLLSRIFGAGAATPIGERLLEPAWEVDAAGRLHPRPGVPAPRR